MVILNNNIEVTDKDLLKYLKFICKNQGYTGLSLYSIISNVTKNSCDGTSEYDFYMYLAKTCNNFITIDYNYSMLSGNIIIDNLYKYNKKSLLYVTELLYASNTLDNDYYTYIKNNIDELENMIIYNNDYLYNYQNLSQFMQMYSGKNLLDKPIETPQYTLIRAAVNLFLPNHTVGMDNETRLMKIKETYTLLSNKKYCHASPTLIGSGFKYMASASCFMFEVQDEIRENDVNGIYDVEKEIALNNKYMGGNGIFVGNIRSAGTRIKSINGGKASGIIPYLKGFAQVNHAVSQANKRPGVTAVFLHIYHPDIKQFCMLRDTGGDELSRARNLNIGIIIPDLFMERVHNNELFSLMDPSECPGLADLYGKEFENLYLEYESKKMYREQVSARKLLSDFILPNMNKTGEPYIIFGDHVNNKSMLKHLCVCNGSNLCCECMLIQTKNETGVCFLSSIPLPSFIDSNNNFNFEELMQVTRVVTRNLDKLIDINNYPTRKAERGSLKTRSIGIGVQGLANVFMQLRLPHGSAKSRILNKQIFEAIYYAAVSESIELAKEYGPYPAYEGSPQSKGILQFDMWEGTQFELIPVEKWNELKEDMKKYGVRNAQLTALMPTASASIFMGFSESFLPVTSNMYRKNNISGENTICNKYMMNHLKEVGLWDVDMQNAIINNLGKLPDTIPSEIRDIYKSVYEIGNKDVIDMCADRAPFIDQSQSMNLHFEEPNDSALYSCLRYAWLKGLKTGAYYTKTKVANINMKMNVCLSCQ